MPPFLTRAAEPGSVLAFEADHLEGRQRVTVAVCEPIGTSQRCVGEQELTADVDGGLIGEVTLSNIQEVNVSIVLADTASGGLIDAQEIYIKKSR